MASGYIVDLPEAQWTTCVRCGGTGNIEQERDCHRSAGIIPCPETGCHRGTIKREVISREAWLARQGQEAEVPTA